MFSILVIAAATTIYERQLISIPAAISRASAAVELERGLEWRRPVGEPRIPRLRQLAQPACFLVEHPDVALLSNGAETASDREVAAIRRPGRIFVLSFGRDLAHYAVLQSDRPHLEISVLLLECDLVTQWRPVRAGSIAPLSRHYRSQ